MVKKETHSDNFRESGMRAFFALSVPADVAEQISIWQQLSLPRLERPVATDNLHITLRFLGEISAIVCDRLIQDAGQVRHSPFTAQFTEQGYFGKTGIAWIGPDAPSAFSPLQRDLDAIARRAGIRGDRRDYQPHITIARSCTEPPPLAMLPPAFEIGFETFVLYESVRGRVRLYYEPVATWPLVS